jgi:hypothetical protein
MDGIDLAWDTVSTVMNLWTPENIGKFISNLGPDGFSRRIQFRGVG